MEGKWREEKPKREYFWKCITGRHVTSSRSHGKSLSSSQLPSWRSISEKLSSAPVSDIRVSQEQGFKHVTSSMHTDDDHAVVEHATDRATAIKHGAFKLTIDQYATTAVAGQAIRKQAAGEEGCRWQQQGLGADTTGRRSPHHAVQSSVWNPGTIPVAEKQRFRFCYSAAIPWNIVWRQTQGRQ